MTIETLVCVCVSMEVYVRWKTRQGRLLFCFTRLISFHLSTYPYSPIKAKIADFDLLKRITEMEGGAKTRVAGTLGYVDPDYRRTQVVTVKSDVYW